MLLLARHQRVDRCGGIHARSDRHAGNRCRQTGDKVVVARAVHIEARGGSTHLAVVEQATQKRALHGFVDIGVSKNDHRILATQLEREAGHVLHRDATDDLAHGGGTGERHLVDLLVRGKRLPDVACPGHQVEHASRNARFDGQLGQAQGGQRGFRRRLDHYRTAGGQCWHQLPGGDHQREVPRHDTGHYPHRLAAGKRRVARALRQRDGDIEGLPFNFRRPTGHVAHEFNGGPDIKHPRHVDRFALAQGFQLRQLFTVRFHQSSEAQQDALAISRAQARPDPCFVRLARRQHSALDQFDAGVGHLGDGLTGRRVQYRRGGTFRHNPLAIDEATVPTLQKSGDLRQYINLAHCHSSSFIGSTLAHCRVRKQATAALSSAAAIPV
ncbi:hypothetical protein D3C81_846450 [compost metagenome]